MNKEKLFDLLENSELLPVPGQNIKDIFQMLQNPIDLDVDLLVEKVAEIDDLNSIILQKINSGYFSIGKKVMSLKEAVVFLGMKTVENLVIFFITRMLFPENTSLTRKFNMSQYWKHVLGTSIASSMLSSRLQIGDKYKLFAYGLIHDIGIAVLDTCLPEGLDEIGVKLQSGIHQIVAEKIVLGGVTHADIGAWLCRKWDIREDIVTIVGYHHTPFLADNLNEELLIMHVADEISSEYYMKLLGLNINNKMSKRAMEALGLSEDDIKYVSDRIPREVEKVHQFMII